MNLQQDLPIKRQSRQRIYLLELAQEHTLVVIEHDMDFVRRLDSTVTVLNEGKVLAEGSLEEMEQNEHVMEAYLGR